MYNLNTYTSRMIAKNGLSQPYEPHMDILHIVVFY